MTMTQEDHSTSLDVSRRGAHRARPNPLLGLLPLIVIGTVLFGVAALVWSLFFSGASRDGSSTALNSSSPTIRSSVAGSSGAGAAASASGAALSGASSQASNQASPSGSASSAGSNGSVDRAITLDYYNGTNAPAIPGQARKAQAELVAAGWASVGKVETWAGPAVSKNTVLYAEPGQLATARAVVKVLGGGTVKLNTTYATSTSLAVIVGDNYQP